MPKKRKVKTPDWILEGYDSPEEYHKSKGITKKTTNKKTFSVKKCPECDSDSIKVVLGDEEGKWICNKCNWTGKNIKKQEMEEEEFIKYLDEKKN